MIDRSEAIRQGMERARAQGIRIGRPRTAKEPEIERLLRAGWSALRVRKELRCGTITVKRVVDRIRSERC